MWFRSGRLVGHVRILIQWSVNHFITLEEPTQASGVISWLSQLGFHLKSLLPIHDLKLGNNPIMWQMCHLRWPQNLIPFKLHAFTFGCMKEVVFQIVCWWPCVDLDTLWHQNLSPTVILRDSVASLTILLTVHRGKIRLYRLSGSFFYSSGWFKLHNYCPSSGYRNLQGMFTQL